MKNLFKNTFRNLAKSKITLVSLSFLVFLAIGIFTLLSSTTKNITNTYNEISKKGNLHDFTVSEQYSLGNTDYALYADGDYDDQHLPPKGGWDGTDINNQFYGYSSDGKIVPWVQVDEDNDNRTWQSTFNPDLCHGIDALKQIWDNENNSSDIDPQLKQLLFPQTLAPGNTILNTFNYTVGAVDHVSTHTAADIETQIAAQYAVDNQLINLSCKEAGDDLYSFVQSNDTPMQKYLDGEKITYRKFSSLDVNQSPDNIYYKNVQSNPEDTIDKMVLFNYKNQDNGENLFSTHDFNPNGVWDNYSNFSTLYEVLKNPTPKDAPTNVNSRDYKDAIAKFKILAYATPTGTIDFTSLSHGDFPSTEYDNYIKFQKNQIVIDTGYKISISGMEGSLPSNYTINDWTSNFAIVSPEYAKEKKLSVFDYKKYFNVNSRDELINVLNSDKYSQDEMHKTLLDITNEHKDNTIVVGGGMPYIILGVGITPDFIYPIINISNPNPNPSKQCIFYSNTSGFERSYDSFKTCPSERYLVCNFNSTNNDNQKKDLKAYNDQAAKIMNFPVGIRAAYLYNDTTDFLNASAFRIAYIPKLVEKIVLVDYILTASVLILSLFVASIVISNYIQRQRKVLGVMRANGIRKREIAFSLLPFALLPTVAGGLVGYLVGLFAQLPFLTLFKSYWMIPTQTFSFAITTFFVMLLVPFVLFTAVAWTTTYITLKTNTVDLMKSGSEYKVNIVQKYAKRPFKHFNILTRFRVSIAFNSISKILVLFATTTITMTALIFVTSNAGKFNEAKNNTFNSRNYSFAVDLYTPTIESGQYVPTTSDYYGDSGILDSPEGKNFMPGKYFLDQGTGTKTVDTGYPEVFGDDLSNNDIVKNYYKTNMPTIKNPDSTIYGNNPNSHQNLIFPMAGDSSGETADLQYLKNTFLDKNSMDMSVGAFGMATNPWNIALSLMPENQSNLISDKEQYILNCAGWKLWAHDIWQYSDPHILSPYLPQFDKNGIEVGQPGYLWSSDSWLKDNGQPIDSSWESFLKCDIMTQVGDLGTSGRVQQIGYDTEEKLINGFTFLTDKTTITESNILIGVGVKPSYVSLDLAMNNDLKVPTTNDKIPFDINSEQVASDNNKFHVSSVNTDVPVETLATDYLYYVAYGTVPLAIDDETYTYLDINHPGTDTHARVTGIKNNSDFINLVDDKGNKINDLLKLDSDKKFNTNIIVNKYAARKYNYKVGQQISLNINNKTDRIKNKLFDIDTNNTIKFNIVGISTSANDEEYFMNQECANEILGLKNTLSIPDKTQPHCYYPKMLDLPTSTKIGNNLTIVGGISGTALDAGTATYWGVQNRQNISDDTNPTPDKNVLESDLVDLAEVDDRNTNNSFNITANGFNGVFTKHSNGSSILNNRMPLYSPSGLYPASSIVSDDTMDTLLKYGSNLQVASQIMGLYEVGLNSDNDSDAAKLGRDIYRNWQVFSKENISQKKADLDSNSQYSKDLDKDVKAFVGILKQYYGNSAYTTLITNAIDKDSAAIIFDNLSSTITEIEGVIISILIIMVLLIIVLISLMVINDARGLAATMKALGYRDHQNIASFMSIYVPVILLSILVSIPLGFGTVSLFNLVMLNGTKIYLTSHLTLTNTIISVLYSLIAFVLSFAIGYWSLKKETLVERLKQ